jgi:hypothetical protein
MKLHRGLLGAFTAVALAVTVTPVATATSASASGHNSNQRGLNSRCNASPYLLCLYWDTYENGALWGTSGAIPNLRNYRFPNNGAGGGQYVKNNAASMSCDTSYLWCYSYYNENYSGNYDYVTPQRSGNLYYTSNDEASVRLG